MPLTRPSLAVAAKLCNHGPLSRRAINARLSVASHAPLAHLSPYYLPRNSRLYSSATASESTPEATHKASRSRRFLKYFFITVLSLATGFTMAAAPALQTAIEIASPPSDEETLTLFAPEPASKAEEANNYIFSHPTVVRLLADPAFKPSRPHLKIPPSIRPHNLMSGTLMGQDRIAVPPLTFTTADGSHFASVQYLGPALCGHPGLIHGGLLATLLDEGLARCCFPALPNKVGVTASLKIDYRKPCKADQYVVLRAETTKVEGRKAWVKGRIETLVDETKGEVPEVLVEAEALFIEPRQAAAMKQIYSNAH